MARRATRGQFLAVILGIGLLAAGVTRLTSCTYSSSLAGPANPAELQPSATRSSAEAAVDAGCIVCVARATEEARSDRGNGNNSGK